MRRFRKTVSVGAEVTTVPDCGFQPPETQDRRQWTAVYVWSLAARKTTTGDGGGWNRQRTGCRPSCRDTVTPDREGIDKRAQPAWSQCVSETAASAGPQHRCDLLRPRRSMYQSGGGIEHLCFVHGISGGARVLGARGKRLCCRSPPIRSVIQSGYFSGFRTWGVKQPLGSPLPSLAEIEFGAF